MADESALAASPSPEELREGTFQSAMAELVAPAVTLAIIAINIVVFLAMVVVSPGAFIHPKNPMMVAWGADFGPLTLHGQWWRVITACFLHFGVIHVGMNMLILFQVGIFAEKLYGHVRFLALYLLAGLGGSVASLFAHPATVAAGASGAVFGVYGAVLAFLLMQRHVIPSERSMSIAKSAGIFIFFNLVYGLTSFQVDMAAHLGGLVSGFVVGCALARPLSRTRQSSYLLRTSIVTVSAIAIAWLSLAGLARTISPKDRLVEQFLSDKSVLAKNDNRVFYTGSATESDANNLADALSKIGYFANRGAAVMLAKDARGTTVSLITNQKDPARPGDSSKPHESFGPPAHLVPYPWEDPGFLAGATMIGTEIAPSVGGPPINLAILTLDGVLEKTIPIDAHIARIGVRDSVWYSGGATLEDAQHVGRQLQDLHFFQDKGGRVFLSRSDNYDVSFIVKQDTWDDPRMVAAFRALGRNLSKSLGGAPVRVHLLDGKMQKQKDV